MILQITAWITNVWLHLVISGITHYVTKYHSKYLFNAHWNVFSIKSSMELSPELHGHFWTTFEQHLWFHWIPWNLSNKTSNSMEFHGILSKSKVLWNSMEFFPYSRVPWNSMELFIFLKKIRWNSMELDKFDIKKLIFLNIVVGIWLMIRCCLAKISLKRYILHWFQYRNSYFEHPSVSENCTRSAKMAPCL